MFIECILLFYKLEIWVSKIKKSRFYGVYILHTHTCTHLMLRRGINQNKGVESDGGRSVPGVRGFSLGRWH